MERTSVEKVEKVILYDNQSGNKAAVAKGSNTVWSNLKQLNLRENSIGEEGGIAIGRNVVWANLEEILLGFNRISSGDSQ